LKPKLDQQALEVKLVQQQIAERWQEYEKMEREELGNYKKLIESVHKYLLPIGTSEGEEESNDRERREERRGEERKRWGGEKIL
jgi:hypothetical protein